MTSFSESELEAALGHALVRDETGDWNALRRRARRHRVRGAARLAAIACALSALGVTTALGVTPGVGSIFGTNAPPPVQTNFARVHFSHGVDPATIRLAAQSRAADGRVLQLWTGRLHNGDICSQIRVGKQKQGAVGCGDDQPSQIRSGLISIPRDPRASMIISGIGPRGTVRVRLGFADRSSRLVATPHAAWVIEIPGRERRYGHDLRTIAALDGTGTTLATEHLQFTQPPVRAVTAWMPVARFGDQLLRAARSSLGGVCVDLHRGDGIGVDTCPGTPRFGLAPPANTFVAWALRLAQQGEPGRLQLFGPLPAGAASARVTFENGSSATAHTAHGAFDIELPQTPARRPARLTLVAADGHAIDSISLRGPAAGGLYSPAWHDARYTIVAFGHMNSRDYMVGPLQWPDGRITPGGPSLAFWK